MHLKWGCSSYRKQELALAGIGGVQSGLVLDWDGFANGRMPNLSS